MTCVFQGHSVYGTHWHNNPGHPMSPGCANMRTDEAGWGFNWASVGIVVTIYD